LSFYTNLLMFLIYGRSTSLNELYALQTSWLIPIMVYMSQLVFMRCPPLILKYISSCNRLVEFFKTSILVIKKLGFHHDIPFVIIFWWFFRVWVDNSWRALWPYRPFDQSWSWFVRINWCSWGVHLQFKKHIAMESSC
jgi:hypothetical protein